MRMSDFKSFYFLSVNTDENSQQAQNEQRKSTQSRKQAAQEKQSSRNKYLYDSSPSFSL